MSSPERRSESPYEAFSDLYSQHLAAFFQELQTPHAARQPTFVDAVQCNCVKVAFELLVQDVVSILTFDPMKKVYVEAFISRPSLYLSYGDSRFSDFRYYHEFLRVLWAAVDVHMNLSKRR